MVDTIHGWSTTAADNDDADDEIDWTEGQLPGTVNNSARAMMRRIAQLMNDIKGTIVTAGTSNAFTVTSNTVPTLLAQGWVGIIEFDRAPTGASTLTLDSLAAKSLVTLNGTALTAADIDIGDQHLVMYDSGSDHYRILTLNSLGLSAADIGVTVQAYDATYLVDADIGSTVQAYDADLTTWAGITPAANVGTFLATPTSANLASAVTDETGSGALVFGTGPTLVTPALGTPSALVLTNATGLPVSGLANGTDGELITWDATGAPATVAVGSANHVLTSNGAGAAPTFQAAAGGGVETVDVQTFTSTGAGTWTKPTGDFTFIRFQCWGAGGGGGRSASAGDVSGGGGGGYCEVIMPFASAAASYATAVGSGGAGRSTQGTGTAGGDTSVGSVCVATGGSGGIDGQDSLGGYPFDMFDTVPAFSNRLNGHWTGGSSKTNVQDDGDSCWGGGAGASYEDNIGVAFTGRSAFAGDGGAASQTGTASAGSAPGGGGGSSQTGTSGAGARGEIIVTCF